MHPTNPAQSPPPGLESLLFALALHGDGGVIALTPDGQLAWSFNTPGIYRARLREDSKLEIGIYGDEP
jgi:isoaspartyl peptidase/L-asparaginase-like protein (Ntn-hydrolase superfamily)